MPLSYKILSQSLDSLTYSANSSTTTTISKIKIKNTSYPKSINISIVETSLISSGIPNKAYLVKAKLLLFNEEISIDGGIIINPGYSLVVSSGSDSSVIIQVYGIEETV